MHNSVNSSYNRMYNPTNNESALSNIKRLLTSRDTLNQSKACEYLIQVINRYSKTSNERTRMIKYLLDNDIIVFLCEATSNLDFQLFRSILNCFCLLWHDPRFFSEEHAAQAMTAVLRALAHYANTGSNAAVDACLRFLCDLLTGITTNKTASPLSNQSAYSAEQLLACLNTLTKHSNLNSKSVLSSALVLHTLVAYQPDNLTLRGNVGATLVEVLKQWFELLKGALNHAFLVGDKGVCGMLFVVTCQLGMDSLRLDNVFNRGDQKTNLVNKILIDEHEMKTLKQSSLELRNCVQMVISELVVFTRENLGQIATEEYRIFLKFLLSFLYENTKNNTISEFCDVLLTKGYLTMLPQTQIARKDMSVRKMSTLVLGELLKVLADKYLNFKTDDDTCSKDIHMGLIELQRGVEKPQSIGLHLQKTQPYSLLIYIYFYCQATDNPEEVTGPLLPYLVQHLLQLPCSFRPPPYIIKALWLVFAMSTISNDELKSLDERVYLEKAIDRIVCMLRPDTSIYYTHHPALLLWSFTPHRIPQYVRLQVLSEWFKSEESLPEELESETTAWDLLLKILVQNKDPSLVGNSVKALHSCLDGADEEDMQDFSEIVWTTVPEVLVKVLADTAFEADPNIFHLLYLLTILKPQEIDQALLYKVTVLLTVMFSKYNPEMTTTNMEARYHFEFVCLKLCTHLLGWCTDDDNRVLLTYINRPGFMPRVLQATTSLDDNVACSALKLLSCLIHYSSKHKIRPKSVLQIHTQAIIKSLRQDGGSERCTALLQLLFMMLNSGTKVPVALSYSMELKPTMSEQCNALRALMFRLQMLCCKETKDQSLTSWKTLSVIFKHSATSTNDKKLIILLISQPWTNMLIQFQLSQKITKEFLNFTNSWLALLRIALRDFKETKNVYFSKRSLITMTLLTLKKKIYINEDDNKDSKEKILGTIVDILNITDVCLV